MCSDIVGYINIDVSLGWETLTINSSSQGEYYNCPLQIFLKFAVREDTQSPTLLPKLLFKTLKYPKIMFIFEQFFSM